MKIVIMPGDRMFTENLQNTNDQSEPDSIDLVITATDGTEYHNACILSFDGFTVRFVTYDQNDNESPEQTIIVTELRSVTINA